MQRLYIGALLFFTACVSPYAQFYEGKNAHELKGVVASNEPIQIFGSSDLESDMHAAWRRGYIVIGTSSFNSGGNMTDPDYARAFAARIGAQLVLIKSQYTHTVSGAIPFQTPSSTTSYTTGSATAYGAGGTTTITGSATTTTYGTRTTYIPYSVARSDYRVVFMARITQRLGIGAVPLDADARARLQTNAGVLVLDVVEGSPAFAADILPGDVLISLGGTRVETPEHYYSLLDQFEGSTQTAVLDRNGERVEKTVEIRKLVSPKQGSGT